MPMPFTRVEYGEMHLALCIRTEVLKEWPRDLVVAFWDGLWRCVFAEAERRPKLTDADIDGLLVAFEATLTA